MQAKAPRVKKEPLERRFGYEDAIVSRRYRVATAAFLICIYASLEAVFTYFVNQLFGLISDQGGDWAEIGAPLAILLALWLFQIMISMTSLLIRGRAEVVYTKHVLNKIFVHLSEIDQAVLDSSNTGEIIARTVEDSKIASKNFLRPLIRIMNAIVTFIATIFVLAIIAWQPTLILTGISLAIAVVTILATGKLVKLNELSRAESSKLWGTFFDAFKNIKFIKVNNLQETYRNDVRKNANAYQDREWRAKRFSALLSTVQQTLFLISWGSTLGISIYYNTAGVLTVAGVVSFVVSGNQLRSPLIEINDEIQSLREVVVSFSRLNALLRHPVKRILQVVTKMDRPDIVFSNVDFTYDGRRPILENCSFALRYGGNYAIVGRTGSGKSTIFDIVTCTYGIRSGSVTVGGLELGNDTAWSVRHAIAISYQLPFLFNDTIEMNVKVLNPSISDERLKEILRVSQVDSIVERLPSGMQSVVGENGVQLSGGERKRIQIAQSLAKDAQIYMFDELTASLDQRTARLMMAGIKGYLKDKTVVFIEHRLNMIEDVDAIYEFKNRTLELVDASAISDR